MIRRILGIAIPNGIENGLFQLAKVALSSITALFGTVQIAANGVAQSFWSVAALMERPWALPLSRSSGSAWEPMTGRRRNII